MAAQTEEGERTEERGPERRDGKKHSGVCYCVRQLRRRSEGELGLDRRAFKVTTVCYPT